MPKALSTVGRWGRARVSKTSKSPPSTTTATTRWVKDIQKKARQQDVEYGQRTEAQQGPREADGARRLYRDIVKQHVGQVSGGVEQGKADPKGRCAERQRKGERQKRYRRNRLQHRPKISAGRASIGCHHFAQHQGKNRTPGPKPPGSAGQCRWDHGLICMGAPTSRQVLQSVNGACAMVAAEDTEAPQRGLGACTAGPASGCAQASFWHASAFFLGVVAALRACRLVSSGDCGRPIRLDRRVLGPEGRSFLADRTFRRHRGCGQHRILRQRYPLRVHPKPEDGRGA